VVSQTNMPLKLTQLSPRLSSQVRAPAAPPPQQTCPIAEPQAVQLAAAPIAPATQAKPDEQVPAPPPGPAAAPGQHGCPAPPQAAQVRGMAAGQ
jgi:hypothetical protein